MAKGHDASDWTVEPDGDEGTVRCPEYRGRFVVQRTGVIKIIWREGHGPEPKDSRAVGIAAHEGN